MPTTREDWGTVGEHVGQSYPVVLRLQHPGYSDWVTAGWLDCGPGEALYFGFHGEVSTHFFAAVRLADGRIVSATPSRDDAGRLELHMDPQEDGPGRGMYGRPYWAPPPDAMRELYERGLRRHRRIERCDKGERVLVILGSRR